MHVLQAAAHKLQVALTHAHLEHHDDHERGDSAIGKEKVTRGCVLRHMREVRDDDEYWSSIYGSGFSTGGRVLTGPGLDWSALNDPRATPTGWTTARPPAGVQRWRRSGARGPVPRVLEGREAYPGRKWYFQNEFCYASGHACHPATLEGRDEL